MRKYIKSLLAVGFLASGLSAEMIRIDTKEMVYDSDTKLMWQDNSDAKTVEKNWQGAIDYCENLKLCGFDDWRLPDRNTLKALYSKKNGLQNIVSGDYWSSTTDASGTSAAWPVNSSFGNDRWYYKTSFFYVRCVRAGQSFDPLIIEAEKIAEQKRIEKEQIAEAKRIEAEKIAEVKRIEAQRIAEVKRIEAQRIAEAEQKHENSWNKASSTNTIASYKEYLKMYPNGNHTSSARNAIENIESENKYSAVLYSKNPQSMYISAVKYENNSERGRAKKIDLTIMDKFETSPMAVKAADRLASLGDVEATEDSNRAKSNAISEATREATRQNSNNSRRQCESQQKACYASCKGLRNQHGWLGGDKSSCESECRSMCN
jgi:hypothetical protein